MSIRRALALALSKRTITVMELVLDSNLGTLVSETAKGRVLDNSQTAEMKKEEKARTRSPAQYLIHPILKLGKSNRTALRMMTVLTPISLAHKVNPPPRHE